MKKRLVSHLLVAALILAQLFVSVHPALAEGERDVLALAEPLIEITGSSFTVYDSLGNPIADHSNIPQNANIKIDYAFRVLEPGIEADEVKAGDYFTIALPSALTSIASFVEVNDRELTIEYLGETYTIGHLDISADGIATVTFAEDVEHLSDVTTSFTIEGSLLEGEIGDDTAVEFELWADGVVYRVGFEDDPIPPEAKIEKSGSYNAAANEITWTVTVDSGGPAVTVENITVVDSLGPNQTYKSSSIPGTLNASGDYEFTLASVTGRTSFTVVTTPTDGAFGAEGTYKDLENDAYLYVEGFAEPLASVHATVRITTDWVRKSGVARNAGGVNYIDWTITINNNRRAIPAGASVSDTLPTYLVLDASTIRRNGNLASSYGDTVATTASAFTYTFAAATSAVEVITFTTSVDDAYYTQQAVTNFANTGTLTIGTNSYSQQSSGVSVGTSLVAKRGAGYDAATQLLTWEIEVNRNGRAIEDAYVTDAIGANQSFETAFVPTIRNGSGTPVELTPASSAAAAQAGTNTYYYDSNTRRLTVGLGDIAASDRPFITFKTRSTNPAAYAGNNTTTYTNGNTILYGGGIQQSSVGSTSQNATSSVIAKASTAYDYHAREISWTITVNGNGMSMPGATVTDIIPAGQAYVEGSLLIDGADPAGRLTVGGNTLTITLGGISTTRVITFRTRVTDPSVFLTTNGDVTFTNRAELDSGISGSGMPFANAYYTVPNKPIVKNLREEYTPANGYIGWEAYVNPNQAPMLNARLIDSLQSGLELDVDSVRLYYWNQSATGAMSLGDEVLADDYSFTYDYGTRVFTITLPDGAQGYRLVFNTDVLRPGTYSNTIGFSGTYTDNDGANSTYFVTENDVAVSGSGWNGSITVTKTDASGNPIALPAVFELLDSMGNVKTTLETDANGVAVFGRLKLRTYYIRERRAPLGYRVDSTAYEVTVSGDTQQTLNRTISISNEPLTASVTLHKTDGDGVALTGGLFRIYRASDTAFETPLQNASAENGVIRFTNLLPGAYAVREISAPLGYAPSDEVVSVSLIVNEETNTLPDAEVTDPIENELLRAGVTMQKTGLNGVPLSGGSFAIYAASDTGFENALQTVAAADGAVTFTGLLAGTYVIRELAAPLGYMRGTETRTVTLALDEGTNTLPDGTAAPMANAPLRADILLRKVDNAGANLTGGTFAVYAAQDTAFKTPLQAVSAANGVIRFTGLLPGDYAVREISAPYGYRASSETVRVSLVLDEQTNTLPNATVETPLVNERAYGAIELKKVDSNNRPLAGATFGLYTTADFLVERVTSDANGIVLFTHVPYGYYRIRELSAPAGYALSGEILVVGVGGPGVTRANPYTIVNGSVMKPPQTGGTELPFGLVLIALSGLLLFAARRRNRDS